MKLLLLGCRGQLGWELQRSLSALGDVTALHRASAPFCGDLARPDALAGTVRALRPDAIVNAAAYTAVDKAETEHDAAFAINGTACGVLAREAQAAGAWLVHFSTDYVFDGSGNRPWTEDDATGPINVYGASKLAGEQAIRDACPRHLIFRTSWVYEAWGGNFLKSMLRLARDRDSLKIVADQWGAPTRAALIADVATHALRAAMAGPADRAGTYHLAAAGETNWHAYARHVIAQGLACGLPLKARPEAVAPIATHEYPVAAARPGNSRLDTSRLRHAFGLALPSWQSGVDAVVAELAAQSNFLRT